MKAILTTYIPVTNTRPNRVKAKAEGVPAVIITWNSSLELEENHKAAALALCAKYDWLKDGKHELAGGGLPNQRGYAFVFVPNFRKAAQVLLGNRAAHNWRVNSEEADGFTLLRKAMGEL